MASRIAIMDAGEIRQVGTPDEIYEQPNSRYTAEFIGSVNIFSGVIKDDEADYVTVDTAECDDLIYIGHGITCFEGQEVSVALRPEKVAISKDVPAQDTNRAQGVVKEIAYLGSHSVYHVQLTSGKTILATELNAERWAGEKITWGDHVWVFWTENAGVVLTA